MDRLWIAHGSWYGSFVGLAWGMDHRVWIAVYFKYESRVWIVVWIALGNLCMIHTRSFWLAAIYHALSCISDTYTVIPYYIVSLYIKF